VQCYRTSACLLVAASVERGHVPQLVVLYLAHILDQRM
jgi:hypothetical protein